MTNPLPNITAAPPAVYPRLVLAIMFLVAARLPGPAFAETADFKSLDEIVTTLNPLDEIDNHAGIHRSIDLNIQFALGSAELLPTAARQIEALAQAIRSGRLNAYQLLLIGHTDSRGSEASNLLLSQRRAEAVRSRLIENYGVAANGVLAQGKGESALLPGLASTDQRQRRVEIVAQPPVGSKEKPPPATEESTSGERAINF